MATRRKKARIPKLTSLYERALKSGTREKIDGWLETIGSGEYIAFLVLLFDSQIGRGGFQFWIHNQNVRYDKALLDLLSEMNVRHAGHVRSLIRKMEKIADRAAEIELKDGPAADAALDRLAGRLSQMDEQYFAIRDEFLTDVEKLLSSMKAAGKKGRSNAKTFDFSSHF